EVIEIDYGKSKQEIQKFHDYGKKVICYFSGGTIEQGRPDYNKFTAVSGLVRNRYSDWPKERWLDYRKDGIRPLLLARMKECVAKGCDAIDVDNVDGYQVGDVKNEWSNPLTKQDAIKFTTWLGKTAHDLGLSIGLKNCLDIVDTVGQYYDFAVNEGCIRRDECHYYKNFLATGKPVLGITYKGLDRNRKALCRNLNGLPISMIIKPGSSLSQESITFDGKKHCGSDFHSGNISLMYSNSNIICVIIKIFINCLLI
ncbi:glycoside hydrolase family 114 protein, partial [Piromyces sp. E2]